jgi:hypothetical protein
MLLLTAGLLMASTATRADETADAVKQWGLIGTWAVDCTKPASRDNTYLSYTITPDGIAVHSREFGGQHDTQDIQRATISSDGALTLRIHFHFSNFAQTREFTVVKDGDQRYRTISNHDMNGSYSIRDGKFTHNDSPSQWLTRCSDASSTPSR